MNATTAPGVRNDLTEVDKATVTAFVTDHLPPGWMADFNGSKADEWAATVLHRFDPEGWPVFTMLRYGAGVAFASVWPCGSQIACILDSLETALGTIPSGFFEAAAGRYGAMEEPSDTRH